MRPTFGSAHLDRQLTSDGQRVTQLRFAATKFAEHLGDSAGLNAAVQQLIQLDGSGRDLNDLGALLVKFARRREAHWRELLRLRLRKNQNQSELAP